MRCLSLGLQSLTWEQNAVQLEMQWFCEHGEASATGEVLNVLCYNHLERICKPRKGILLPCSPLESYLSREHYKYIPRSIKWEKKC